MMKSSNMSRSKGQVYSVGNYLMTGKVLGKGHFARVEEATHRIIGKKVAIKIIDLTSIKEEYARRNLHREPRVMAKLRHPCIAALYETMMHGPRLYVVMEAACGGDLCSLVLEARGGTRGLPESRARPLAAQLVSAVRHMHAAGVVHRDLKMENIMLDSTKTLIKIVDFGLSNVWSSGGSLRTPCGSLEYAAPELFGGGGKYGPEVDLWSIGVIVYGMVTGGLPFTGEGGEGRSRPLLRANIARGFSRKQRNALHALSLECKAFIQHLLEPNVETRMRIEEASRHRWVKRPGLRMKTFPLAALDPKLNREIYRQISELCGQSVLDVVSQIKADSYGAIAGMYNLKCHLSSLGVAPGPDLLWSSAQDTRPLTPPDYQPPVTRSPDYASLTPKPPFETPAKILDIIKQNGFKRTVPPFKPKVSEAPVTPAPRVEAPSPRFMPRCLGLPSKPVFKVYDSGDCGPGPRLPSIDEHSNTDLSDIKRSLRRNPRAPTVKKVTLEEERPFRLNSCPNKIEEKQNEFYRRAGDGLPSWRASGAPQSQPTRILLQSNATTIKRASLGNIVSPHSSTNSHCKSERAMPVGWFSTRGSVTKEPAHLQRFRRTATTK